MHIKWIAGVLVATMAGQASATSMRAGSTDFADDSTPTLVSMGGRQNGVEIVRGSFTEWGQANPTLFERGGFSPNLDLAASIWRIRLDPTQRAAINLPGPDSASRVAGRVEPAAGAVGSDSSAGFADLAEDDAVGMGLSMDAESDDGGALAGIDSARLIGPVPVNQLLTPSPAAALHNLFADTDSMVAASEATPVAEPGTLVLIGLPMVWLAALRRRRSPATLPAQIRPC